MTTRCEGSGPEIEIDRGQPVIVIAHFGDGDPEVVNFLYTRPGSERPYVDDGYGQPRSQIVRLDHGVYRYVIPTRDFDDGEGSWCFAGEWADRLEEGYDEVVIRGVYRVRPSPKSLA